MFVLPLFFLNNNFSPFFDKLIIIISMNNVCKLYEHIIMLSIFINTTFNILIKLIYKIYEIYFNEVEYSTILVVNHDNKSKRYIE